MSPSSSNWGAAVCAISPADVESNLKDFRAGLPMNLLQKHLSHCSVAGQSRGVCLLARRGLSWMANTKVDNAIFPYSWLEACAPGGGPAWGLGCRICRLCYNPNGKNEHGGPWAQLDVRGSLQKCNIKNTKQALVTKERKQRSSRRLPDVITIPWFKLPSSHRPWNTSSRSSAG
jgi:hypothetical protein